MKSVCYDLVPIPYQSVPERSQTSTCIMEKNVKQYHMNDELAKYLRLRNLKAEMEAMVPKLKAIKIGEVAKRAVNQEIIQGLAERYDEQFGCRSTPSSEN